MLKAFYNWYKSLFPKELPLPSGKTCDDCTNFEFCYYLKCKERTDTTCCYNPIKFEPNCYSGMHLKAKCPGDCGK